MIKELVVPSPQPSFKAMKQGVVPCDLIIDNFGTQYKCHAVVICAIAPKILENRSADNGSRIILELPDKQNNIGKIIDFCYGDDLIINQTNCESLFLISTRIGSKLIADKAQEVMKSILSPENVCQSILFLFHYHLDYSMHIQYIKDHFSEMMTQASMYQLPVTVLQEIASCDTLCTQNEDDIALWVQHVIENRGEETKSLVDSLHLERVSKDVILSLCSTQPLDPKEILEKVKDNEAHPKPQRVYGLNEEMLTQLVEKGNRITIEAPQDIGPKGIIKYIMSKGGIVHVAVSSVNYKYFEPQNLLALDNKHSIWYSNNKPNQWVTYDFSPYLVAPNRYYLRTSGSRYGSGHMQNWVVLGSNDQKKWIELDKQTSCDLLNGGYKEAMFPCSTNDFYRFIKIQQVGFNLKYEYSMQLSAFECFGELIENE